MAACDCSDDLRRETLAAVQLVRQLCQQLVSAPDEEQLVRQCRALPLPAGVPAPSASDPLLLLINTLTELTVSLPLQSVDTTVLAHNLTSMVCSDTLGLMFSELFCWVSYF